MALIFLLFVGNLYAASSPPRWRVTSAGQIEFLNTTGDIAGKIKTDGTLWVQTMHVSTDVVAEITPYTISVSTTGTPLMDTGYEITFSSDVTIVGSLKVNSTKAKAIYVPTGGIHLSEDPDANAPPGQMFSKKVKTSTLTFIGSALLFENGNGVVLATMTATSLTIDGINAKGVATGNLKNSNRGAGAPAAGDCVVANIGLQYLSDTPARLYICADDGAGGAMWRSTNLN